MRHAAPSALTALASLAFASPPASGQDRLDRPVEDVQPHVFDGGYRHNPGAASATVDAHLVHVPDAGWLRVFFGAVELAPGSFVRMTSTLDGETQSLDAAALETWRHGSAYFNGDTVLVELVAAAGTAGNRLVISDVGLELVPDGSGGAAAGGCGVCGPDDRVPTEQHWAGRLLPGGCTASVWNSDSCLVSAGHCIGGTMVIQFQVPASNPDCSLNHPPVEDQFPVPEVIFVSAGVGDDWAVMTTGVNDLGETPFERFGEMRSLSPSPVTSDTLTVTGYGVDTECERTQTQQTSDGTLMSVGDTFFTHDVDTTYGNSGSSLVQNGTIVGIATHCNCPNNSATRIDHPDFAAARRALCPAVTFDLPDGLPEVVDPAGGTTVTVTLDPQWATPFPGSGEITIRNAGRPEVIDMVEVEPNVYEATFPAYDCGTTVQFYFSIVVQEGFRVYLPAESPIESFTAIVGQDATTLVADDFETDLGWTVESSPGLTSGAWERGVPVDCGVGDPPADADGSGQCYVTENSADDECVSDVDGGTTMLVSPVLDATGDGPVLVEYHRWFDNNQGNAPFTESFTVEVSDDGGATWSTLETVGPAIPEVSGGWFHRQHPIAAAGIEATDQLRVRFIAADPDPGSLVEAAIDGFRLVRAACDGPACPADLDGDGAVGVLDLVELVVQWGPCPPGPDGCPADLDGDDQVGVLDLVELLVQWGDCS